MIYQQLPSLIISGLQEEYHSTYHQCIQQTIKQCFGLFPKHSRYHNDATLAQYFHLAEIIAVSHSSHVYADCRYRREHYATLRVNYDEYWQSLGGMKNQQGLYLLSTSITCKAITDMPSKKREPYQHRYTLLDEIEHSMLQQLFLLTQNKSTNKSVRA